MARANRRHLASCRPHGKTLQACDRAWLLRPLLSCIKPVILLARLSWSIGEAHCFTLLGFQKPYITHGRWEAVPWIKSSAYGLFGLPVPWELITPAWGFYNPLVMHGRWEAVPWIKSSAYGLFGLPVPWELPTGELDAEFRTSESGQMLFNRH